MVEQIYFPVLSGSYGRVGDTLVAGFLFSAPTCLALGAAFNYAAKAFNADEANLVSLYIYEALGSAAAGIASLLMSGRVSALNQILVCALLSAIAGAIMLEHKKGESHRGVADRDFFRDGLFFSGQMESSLVRYQWSGQEVVAEQESKYSTITITQRESQTTFWLDGFPAFSSPNREFFEKAVHLPLSMCENPARVLLIGGGLVPAAQELFKYPVQELVYVQIDPQLTRLEEKYLPGFDAIPSDRRIRIVHQDARIFMQKNVEPFNAIIVNLPSPETANLNRYYTREFFKLARKNLKDAECWAQRRQFGQLLVGRAGRIAGKCNSHFTIRHSGRSQVFRWKPIFWSRAMEANGSRKIPARLSRG